MIHELSDGFLIELESIIAISAVRQQDFQIEAQGNKPPQVIKKYVFKIFTIGLVIQVFRDVKELIDQEHDELVKAWREIKK